MLFEAASGYSLFEVVEAEEIAAMLGQVQEAVTDMSRFSRIVKLKAFSAFTTAANALENINAVSENLCTDDLKNFLEMNLPKHKAKAGKAPKFYLGVSDPKMGTAVQETTGLPCNSNETVSEILRGIRNHFHKYVKGLDGGVLEKSQLGLAHSYSRAKVKFNVNRSDNMIIQAIALLDQLDKDLNTFAMRVREWYSWHFPELAKIVKDNYVYARVAKYIGNRKSLSTRDEADVLKELTSLVLEEDDAKAIVSASRSSMGMDMAEVDMEHVDTFATKLISLAQYRINLSDYLKSKMSHVAPNLGALIGETVAARLISHAGSLTNLAKCPASTVQILGAEKALFRALKTKSNTPKYGIIFHSSFIGRAGAKNKGRISRYLANKCAMSARIDAFADISTTKYGEALKEQVEERLKFYDSGETPRKNIDVMTAAGAGLGDLGAGGAEGDGGAASAKKKDKKSKKEKKAKKEKRKRSSDDSDDEDAGAAAGAGAATPARGGDDDDSDDEEAATPAPAKKSKKEKKEKKAKKEKKKKKDKA